MTSQEVIDMQRGTIADLSRQLDAKDARIAELEAELAEARERIEFIENETL